MRVLAVSSSGGHLNQLVGIINVIKFQHEIILVTFDKPDASELKSKLRFYGLSYPTNRNVKNNVLNLAKAWKIAKFERPDVYISTGAAPAFPFAIMASLSRKPFLYVEPIDRIKLPTLTAKLLRVLRVDFVVFWPSQLNGYPNRTLIDG